MSELKTLKDFEDIKYPQWILKQEVIKWIKIRKN